VVSAAMSHELFRVLAAGGILAVVLVASMVVYS
jgi:hypothetical protein